MSELRDALDDRLAMTAACSTIGLPVKSRNREDVFSIGEWNLLSRWLGQLGCRPAQLLFSGIVNDLDHADLDRRVARKAATIPERASATLEAMDALYETGIWVRARIDAEYPLQWKQRLKANAPPVVFGVGTTRLLCQQAVAIIGSREVTSTLAETAESMGISASRADLVVISGAARGTDRFGMRGALKNRGRSIGVLAGSLQRIARDRDLHGEIEEERLCLVSHVNPAAGFTVGNAMARNRLIYALSDLAIVVSTTEGTGGTWAGAIENFNRRWAPIAVWNGTGAPDANARLIELGAVSVIDIPKSPDEMRQLVDAATQHWQTAMPGTRASARLIQETAPPVY